MATVSGLELLISKELEDEEFKQALDDIHNFKLGVIRNLSKADIEDIQHSGFRFRTKTLAGMREEIKQFILEHPSLMSQDADSIKYKFKILGRILKKKEATRQATVIEEEEDFEEEEEKPKKQKKQKKKARAQGAIQMSKPKVVMVSSSDSDDGES